jgi:thiamine pyrophosphokinase
MRAVIFLNGYVTDYQALARHLKSDDYLICADGGTTHCLALHLRPHVVVGDLDSTALNVIQELARQGTIIERHPIEKDQTDLELAVVRALREGADNILLLGALGGRLDQMLANVLLLAQSEWPVPISLAEGPQIARLMRDGETLTLDGQSGDTVSVIPISRAVTGITYSGLVYALEDVTLELGTTRGISNVMAQPRATIQIGSGLLLVIHTQRQVDTSGSANGI